MPWIGGHQRCIVDPHPWCPRSILVLGLRRWSSSLVSVVDRLTYSLPQFRVISCAILIVRFANRNAVHGGRPTTTPGVPPVTTGYDDTSTTFHRCRMVVVYVHERFPAMQRRADGDRPQGRAAIVGALPVPNHSAVAFPVILVAQSVRVTVQQDHEFTPGRLDQVRVYATQDTHGDRKTTKNFKKKKLFVSRKRSDLRLRFSPVAAVSIVLFFFAIN